MSKEIFQNNNELSEKRLHQEASDFLFAHLDVLTEYNPTRLEEMYRESLHPDVDTTQVDKALDIAKVSHKDHRRKLTGAPYIIHPLQVGTIANKLFVRELAQGRELSLTEAAVISPAHDTVEDCETAKLAKATKEKIKEELGDNVEDAVYALSKIRYSSQGNRYSLTEPRYCNQINQENRKQPDLGIDVIKCADNIVNLVDPLDIPESFDMKKRFEQERNRESTNVLNPISIVGAAMKEAGLHLNHTSRNRDAHIKTARNKREKIIRNTQEHRIDRLFESQGRHDLAVFLQTAVDLSKQTLEPTFDPNDLLEARKAG